MYSKPAIASQIELEGSLGHRRRPRGSRRGGSNRRMDRN
jgi:hypothetical protein